MADEANVDSVEETTEPSLDQSGEVEENERGKK